MHPILEQADIHTGEEALLKLICARSVHRSRPFLYRYDFARMSVEISLENLLEPPSTTIGLGDLSITAPARMSGSRLLQCAVSARLLWLSNETSCGTMSKSRLNMAGIVCLNSFNRLLGSSYF